MGRTLRIFLLALASGLMVVAVVVASTDDDDYLIGLGVLPAPELGRTDPGVLHDGSPVFVAHDLDGTISVLDATSTHLATNPMGWCATSRTIEDIFRGARWDAQGRYVSGPAPADLGSYEYVIDGRSQDIVVLMYVAPQERTSSPLDTITNWCAEHGGYETHPSQPA
jgi:hypothetical protein